MENENNINDLIKDKRNITFDTKTEIKEASSGLSATATFVGLYLGIIFLLVVQQYYL